MKAGDKMPIFQAPDQTGKRWKTEDLLGKTTVIYTYPKDSTPGCTAEACNIRDNYRRFLAAGYNVVGVSKDSVDSHKKFAEKYELPFPILSDPDHRIIEALGAWGEKKLYGVASVGTLRKTFIFDASGICTQTIDKVDTKDHTSQILK